MLFTAIAVLGIATMIYAQYGGTLPQTTKENLMPGLSVTVIEPNVKMDPPIPLSPEGYLYSIHAEPQLNIEGDNEADVITILSFKGIDVKAKVDGDADEFHAKEAIERHSFDAEITSVVPPLVEWANDRQLQDEIPVVMKSNTGKWLMLTARTSKATPVSDCRSDFIFECDNGYKETRYLQPCGSDDPLTKCNQKIDVCGGTADVTVLENDCSSRKISANIFYRNGKDWTPVEEVGISFWDKNCPDLKRITNVDQLKGFCPEYRLGGRTWMEATASI